MFHNWMRFMAFSYDQGMTLHDIDITLSFGDEPGSGVYKTNQHRQTSLFGNHGFSIGQLIGKRYEIEACLGNGNFGEVYLAKDRDVAGHRVALKILKTPSRTNQDKEKALSELKILASVFHPSITQFKDHGWLENRLWFVMPFYEGKTLDKHIRTKALKRDQAYDLFEPLARALSVLHRAEIKHRDIKPENIMLAELHGAKDELLPVLLDLGVASNHENTLVAGTPLYFAPEMAKLYMEAQVGSSNDHLAVGEKADVYSLALSLRNALEPELEEDVEDGGINLYILKRATEAVALPKKREHRYLRASFKRWLALEPTSRPTAEQFANELQILIKPELNRARRKTIFQWLFPVLAVLGTVFVIFFTKFQLDITQVSQQLGNIQKDLRGKEALLVEHSQRNAVLKEQEELLKNKYIRESHTRSELANQLAHLEIALPHVEAKLASTERKKIELETALLANQTSLMHAQQKLHEQTGQLLSQSQLRTQLESQVYNLTETNRNLKEALADFQSSVSKLTEERDASRIQLRNLLEENAELKSRLHSLPSTPAHNIGDLTQEASHPEATVTQ